ncbi:MAG: HAD hydrolase-like protein [Oscillospiraceae bacterium]|nr:HAD hydrolase-like protein [Oscillospiraceae bacterium]
MQLCYQTVLFDFDGTICDTGEGIIECVKLALQEMGQPVPPLETLRRFVGPPAEQGYMMYCGMPLQQATEAVQHFRVHYNADGWKKTTIYPGIPELLRDLRQCGAAVCIASSKPQPMVERLLEKFQIQQYFTAVSAADSSDQHSEKETVIRHALKMCPAAGRDNSVMVGDTRFDVLGARKVGLPFLGAAYGYGGPQDFCANGQSVPLADSPDGLRQYLFRA